MDSSEKWLFRKVAFSKRLVQARIHLGLSQEALAEAVGTMARSISRWEHDQAIPQHYYRQRLCEVLQSTPEELFAANDEKVPIVSQSASFWYVPYTRNPYFIGRESLLTRLHEMFHTEPQIALTQPQILSGLGGIGKTQIALEYAYRFRDDYQTVVWVRTETTETLHADYLTLAHLFQLPEKDSSNHFLIEAAVKRWFQCHSNWLLIFDSVEDLDMLYRISPDSSQGHILIITCTQITGTLGSRLNVRKMMPDEGALFLLRRAKLIQADVPLMHAPASLRSQADTLVDLLDGLPLALDQAAAYIEETACSLSEYLERYTLRRKDLLTIRGSVDNHHPASVATTLSLAVQQVERVSPIAVDLLRFCAFLRAEAIPEELFSLVGENLCPQLRPLSTDPLVFDVTIKELRRFSLIRREQETKTLSIHRLLQVIIKDGMNENECKWWMASVIHTLLQVIPDYRDIKNFDVRSQLHFKRYLPHMLACAAQIKKWNILSEDAEEFLHRLILAVGTPGGRA